MSGGVDSSVACHLLLQKGYDVVGVFMRHGEEVMDSCDALPLLKSNKQGCCSAADAEDARRVADRLGIPFYALNLKQDFGRIIDYFVDDYQSGRTPNPCVMCNIWLKFGKLFDYADTVGARYVATGHYARLREGSDGLQLCRGLDGDKDQSYVLFGVAARHLSRMLLPIGDFKKSEIRSLADSYGLQRVAQKPDSQEICFVAAGQHASFVAERATRRTQGEMVTTDGTVVAQHAGIEGFTIGQRKGLGVALGEPYFVVHIDADKNQVVIGRQSELQRSGLVADQVNWLAPPRTQPFRCLAQIRYNSRPHAATCHPDGQQLRIQFDEPCLRIAPGQAVVCYDDDRVLAGGWIRQSFS